MTSKIFDYDAIIFDMDGVIWRGENTIEENITFIRRWKEMGKVVRFLTNNSTKTREHYMERLRKVGINVRSDEIVTSSWAAAQWLKRKGIDEVFLIGEEGLISEIERVGIKVIKDPFLVIKEKKSPPAVVLGMDRGFTYYKLWAGMIVIERGGLFVVTNEDATYPVPGGKAPGGGSLASALKRASGKRPNVVVGKPNRYLFHFALRDTKIPKKRILMVGDRIETDIKGANRIGIDSILVLTGVSSMEDVNSSSIKPKYVVGSLDELLK